MRKRNWIFFLSCAMALPVFAQEDMMGALEAEAEADLMNQKVTATFKAGKVINAQSVETVKGKTLDFRVGHRFGNIIEQSKGTGGFHEFFGFDNASDMRISVDYGITDNIQIGYGRSKQSENYDGSLKCKILSQTENNKIPLTIVWYSDMAVSARRNTDSLFSQPVHRFSYVHQLILGRKFSNWFSLEILPTVVHFNAVKAYQSVEGKPEENTMFALGVAGRIKLTNRLAIVADYFHLFSPYRAGTPDPRDPNKAYFSPLGLGVELETGGHVFTINFTNSGAIQENLFITNTTESWNTGAVKLGFTISRVFTF